MAGQKSDKPYAQIPSSDGTDNVFVRDVIGGKEDTAVITVGNTPSLMAYQKGLLNQAESILADTDELQSDFTDGGRIDLILDELTAQWDTNEGKIDTIDTNVDLLVVDMVNNLTHHEKIYPYATSGVEVTPGDQVWGTTYRLIPVDGIIDDYGWDGTGSISAYALTGFTYLLSAGASKPNTVQYLRIVKTSAQILSGDTTGGQSVIGISTTGGFLADDIAWITDTDTADGEVGKIDSIITDTSITLTENLVNSYTTASDATVYLVRRGGDNAYRSLWHKFGHADTKTIVTHYLHAHREMEVGDGILVRAYGIDDAAGVMLISAIYDDDVPS